MAHKIGAICAAAIGIGTAGAQSQLAARTTRYTDIFSLPRVHTRYRIRQAMVSSVVTVAKAVQDAVRNAVESMTGVKILAVNVNVCRIIRQ